MKNQDTDVTKAIYQKPVIVELTIQFTNGGMAGVFEFNINGIAAQRSRHFLI